MSPLSDRVVITLLIATVALVFALVFWTVRLAPSAEPRTSCSGAGRGSSSS